MTVLLLEFPFGYHAADPSYPSMPEWPPHPDRLFQALVATAYESKLMPAMRDVLEELERSAPEVHCSDALQMEAPKAYVPTNFDVNQVRAERRFPFAVPAQTLVGFRWPRLSRGTQAGLAELAPLLTHVGRAKSLVKAAVSEAVPEGLDAWLPDPKGQLLLRVPHSGRLAELDAAFDRGRRPPPPRLGGYALATERIREGPWRELVALRLDRPLALERCVAVTESLRAAVMSVLGDDAPSSIHGHGAEDHVAWTPLPDVGHAFASGEFRGIGAWLPATVRADDRIAILQAMRELDHVRIRGIDIKVQFETQPPLARQADTWTRPSRIWASVTPVVADRVPKKGQTLAASLRLSFQWAGYPIPVRVDASGYSAFGAAPRANAVKTRALKRLRTHVVVEFAERVAGPVLVGAERFFGLGMFRPLG